MKNITLSNVDHSMLVELSKKQGVNINSFVSTLINNLYTDMKKQEGDLYETCYFKKNGYGL